MLFSDYPMIGAYAELLAVALVPAAYPQEVSTVVDRPMQGCADGAH